MTVSGPSKSGKTYFLLKLLDRRGELFHNKIDKILWCYGISDMKLLTQLRSKGYKTLYGLPQEENIEPNSIYVRS